MRKVLSLLLIIALAITLFSTVVYADSLTFSLKADKTVYIAGETIAVTVESSDTNYVGGKFEIDYDESKVKYLSTYTAGNTGMFAMPNTKGVPSVALAGSATAQGTTIYTFNFEVLENVSGDAVFSLLVSEITDTTWNYTSNYAVGSDLSVKIRSFSVDANITVGNEIAFDITITDCPNSGVIYAAVYDGSILKACTKEAFTTPITNKTINVEKVTGDTAKIFLWTVDGAPILETPLEKEI